MGIAEMFAELDGYDRMEMALAVQSSVIAERRRNWHATPQARAKAVQRNASWRRRNRKKFAGYVKKWRDRNPDKFRAMRRRADKRAIAKNPEKYRAMWRAAAARRRARKAAV